MRRAITITAFQWSAAAEDLSKVHTYLLRRKKDLAENCLAYQ